MSEQVTDDIFVARQVKGAYWPINIVLVFGVDSIGVVDTGYENTPEDYVFPLIAKKGRSLSEVSLIVNTHRDGDHVNGNPIFKERTQAPIAIHELELEAVPTADITLGEDVRLGDRVFKVIHTPGHTPGSICLYDEADKILLTGDSVCGSHEGLIRMDKEIYIESMKRLQDLDVDLMIMSHPFDPPGTDILRGEESRDMISTSIDIALKKKE